MNLQEVNEYECNRCGDTGENDKLTIVKYGDGKNDFIWQCPNCGSQDIYYNVQPVLPIK